MTCCFTAQPELLASPALDPSKHVNYVLGMILGEDDFKQEFAYLSGRDQWLARDLIGYGTVRGLDVRVEMDGNNGPRIYVSEGVALTPRGQLVCVPVPQCAHVNAWLQHNAADVQKTVTSPTLDSLPLYLVLCYRDCPTDKVPIPGEPCRTEDQLVKPSRLRDDFVLQLSLTPPVQREEKALRDFCEWLRRVVMSDPSVTSIDLDQFLDEIRRAAAPWYSSPPASPPPGDFLLGSPPALLRVHPSDAHRYLRAAFHLWVTELRPKWIGRWYGCAPDLKKPEPPEDCVLLAELRVGLVFDSPNSSFQARDDALPDVNQSERPYLLHLRMLQEWLLSGVHATVPDLAGDADGPLTGNTVGSIRGVDVITTGASDGHILRYRVNPLLSPPGGQWLPEPLPAVPPPPPLPVLAGDAAGPITANTVNRVRGIDVITTGAADGQVLRFRTATNQWLPEVLPAAPAPAVLAGDAAGPITANTVNRVRGIDVITTGAGDGQVLRFRTATNQWVPEALPPAPGGQFTGRATAALYEIVAAGMFEFGVSLGTTGVTGPQPTAVGVVYNNLRPTTGFTAAAGCRFTFTGYQDPSPAGSRFNYIVKLTPWTLVPMRDIPFAVYFAGFRAQGFHVMVALPPPGKAAGRMMIEVSRYES